jgi:Na+/H+-dicarboxylate symporter
VVAKDVNTAIKVGKMFGNAIAILCIPFVLSTIYFGIRKGENNYYETDKYNGNGTAH